MEIKPGSAWRHCIYSRCNCVVERLVTHATPGRAPIVIYQQADSDTFACDIDMFKRNYTPMGVGHFWTDYYITADDTGMFTIDGIIAEYETVADARFAMLTNPQWGFKPWVSVRTK